MKYLVLLMLATYPAIAQIDNVTIAAIVTTLSITGGVVGQDSYSSFGYSFIPNGALITGCSFHMYRKNVNGASHIRAKIYAHTGLFGVSSNATGAALATSNDVDESVLPTIGHNDIEFTFSTPFQSASGGTPYIIAVEDTGSTDAQWVAIVYGADGSTVGTIGNSCKQDFSTGDWTTSGASYLYFHVYGILAGRLSVSGGVSYTGSYQEY